MVAKRVGLFFTELAQAGFAAGFAGGVALGDGAAITQVTLLVGRDALQDVGRLGVEAPHHGLDHAELLDGALLDDLEHEVRLHHVFVGLDGLVEHVDALVEDPQDLDVRGDVRPADTLTVGTFVEHRRVALFVIGMLFDHLAELAIVYLLDEMLEDGPLVAALGDGCLGEHVRASFGRLQQRAEEEAADGGAKRVGIAKSVELVEEEHGWPFGMRTGAGWKGND